MNIENNMKDLIVVYCYNCDKKILVSKKEYYDNLSFYCSSCSELNNDSGSN